MPSWLPGSAIPQAARRSPSMTDSRPAREPLLTQPFEGGVTGWIVVFGAVLAELVGGIVTSHMATSIALPVLAVPVTVAFGFAIVQWWQARASDAGRASWWHLGGIAAAAFTWWVWPTFPGVLVGATSAPAACSVLPAISGPSDCLSRAAQALDNHNFAWWSAAALIVVAALLARRSRIAAWAAIPAALAGCQLATHFLTQLLVHYHLDG